MKKGLTICLVFAALVTAFAQDEPAFHKGVNIAGAGIGFPSLLGNALSNAGYTVDASAPIQLFYERGLSDKFGLGAAITFANVKANTTLFGSTYRSEYDLVFIAAKGNYYFVRKPKVSLSGGLYLGFISVSAKASSGNSSATALASGVGYQLFINGKYHFSKNFLAFAELGYGISIVNIGVAGQF